MTHCTHSPCCPPPLTADQLAADPSFGGLALYRELRDAYGHTATVRLWRDAAAIWRECWREEVAA